MVGGQLYECPLPKYSSDCPSGVVIFEKVISNGWNLNSRTLCLCSEAVVKQVKQADDGAWQNILISGPICGTAYLINCIVLAVFGLNVLDAIEYSVYINTATFLLFTTSIHTMVSEYSDVKTHLSIQSLSQQLMTSYIFSDNRTCSQSLFSQTSHWAKVLLPAKGCNLSHTWLVLLRPITASPSQAHQSVRQ